MIQGRPPDTHIAAINPQNSRYLLEQTTRGSGEGEQRVVRAQPADGSATRRTKHSCKRVCVCVYVCVCVRVSTCQVHVPVPGFTLPGSGIGAESEA